MVSETFAATITIVVVVVARILSLPRRILYLLPSRIQLEKDPVISYIVVGVIYFIASNLFNQIRIVFGDKNVYASSWACCPLFPYIFFICYDIAHYMNVVRFTSRV